MNINCREAWNIAKTLHKKSVREETGLFLIEGHREIDLAKKSGVEIIQVLDRTNTSEKNMERISYCGEIVAVAKIPKKNLCDFDLPMGYEKTKSTAGNHAETHFQRNPLLVVLDNPEKPGNIGAAIRTAEAASVSAVIICGGAGDLSNPNLIRASLGAVFSLPVFCASSQDAAQWLARHEIQVVAAMPDATMSYFDYDFNPAVAVVVGSESDGISEFWVNRADSCVSIPMTGAVNSLNASVSAAVLIYEAVSQRLQASQRL